MTSEPPLPNATLERRGGPRVDLFREITCAAGSTVVRSPVADLSEGGMFLDAIRTPFPVGRRVTVRFSLRPADAPLALEGEVGYVQEGIGMGVRFVGLAEPDRRRIAAFVEEALRRKRSGGPPLRKSARVTVQVPIRVSGSRADGDVFDDTTRVVTLSKHGACLVSSYNLAVGTRLHLVTARGREFTGNVVWVGSVSSGNAGQVGVQCRGLAQALGFQFP